MDMEKPFNRQRDGTLRPSPDDFAWLAQQFPGTSSLTPLASGGQKSVFTGTHQDDGEVVLKIFHASAEPERALREIEAVNSINSERIPRIFEFGSATRDGEELIWVREQQVPGKNLKQLLTQGPLRNKSILSICSQMLEALAAAEQEHIVHRDVKPDNIIFNTDSNMAWLLDFGIARHLDLESLTSNANQFGLGTLGYFPPEQFRNRKSEIDSRADLFSLGVTLYECIEGRNPFLDGARDPLDVIHRLEKIPLPAITSDVVTNNELRELLLAMTRTRRDHRIATVADALSWMQDIHA